MYTTVYTKSYISVVRMQNTMYTTVYAKSYTRVVYTQIIYKCLIYAKYNVYYGVY